MAIKKKPSVRKSAKAASKLRQAPARGCERAAEAQLSALIDTFAPTHLRLIAQCGAHCESALPTARDRLRIQRFLRHQLFAEPARLRRRPCTPRQHRRCQAVSQPRQGTARSRQTAAEGRRRDALDRPGGRIHARISGSPALPDEAAIAPRTPFATHRSRLGDHEPVNGQKRRPADMRRRQLVSPEALAEKAAWPSANASGNRSDLSH